MTSRCTAAPTDWIATMAATPVATETTATTALRRNRRTASRAVGAASRLRTCAQASLRASTGLIRAARRAGTAPDSRPTPPEASPAASRTSPVTAARNSTSG